MADNGHIGEIVRQLIQRHHLDRRMRERAVAGLWGEVAGADIARNCRPLGVRDGVLLIGATNHAWAQTLSLMRAQLVEALNARAGAPVLRDLAVRVVAATQSPGPVQADAGAAGASLPPLTEDQQRRVRELSGRIGDPALRAKVRRALAVLLRRQRQRDTESDRPCPSCGRPVGGRTRRCPTCRGAR